MFEGRELSFRNYAFERIFKRWCLSEIETRLKFKRARTPRTVRACLQDVLVTVSLGRVSGLGGRDVPIKSYDTVVPFGMAKNSEP